MEAGCIELCGIYFDAEMLHDILLAGAVSMEVERQNPITCDSRKQFLESRVNLAKELMKRLPFDGNGVSISE